MKQHHLLLQNYICIIKLYQPKIKIRQMLIKNYGGGVNNKKFTYDGLTFTFPFHYLKR